MAFYQYRDAALETIARNIIKKYDACLEKVPAKSADFVGGGEATE